jgi:uncharacterized protein YjlB
MPLLLTTYQFNDDGTIPNNPLPVLLYGQVCEVADQAAWFERQFHRNGWTNNWRDIILPYDHFHSTTHEVLGVAKGTVVLQLGGRKGREVRVRPGDVLVLPAGVGHCALPGEGDYEIVGGYPNGRAWDLLRGSLAERTDALPHIKALPIPATDPFLGRPVRF